MSPGDVMSDLHPELVQKIDQTVDSMVAMLKSQILSGGVGGEGGADPKRGIWDRFKNWMSNMWYGRYSNKNPYYFMNTLGDFAGSKLPPKTAETKGEEEKKESFCPRGLSLSEYQSIRSMFEELESELSTISEADLPAGAENLRVVRVIDDWGKNLKLALKKIMMDHERTTPETPPTDPKNPEEIQCLKDLEKKHADGKISDAEYEKIKLMVRHGRVDMACRALSEILDKPPETKPTVTPEVKARIEKAFRDLEVEHNRPGVGNAMPDNIYERIKSQLQEIESSETPDLGKLAQLEREITGISGEEKTPPPPESEDETKFPYNKGSDVGAFLSIKRELRSRRSPSGADKSYGEMFDEWGSKVGRSGKKVFLDLEQEIAELLADRPEGFESKYEDLLRKYKDSVARIVNATSGEIDHGVEESVSPTSHMSLTEKTNYYKSLLRRR